MRRHFLVPALALTLALAAAPTSYADTEVAAGGTSTVKKKSSPLDNFRASYWGQYSGSTLSLKGYHPDENGRPVGPVGAWNQLTAGYRFVPNFQVEAHAIFDWRMTEGQSLTMLNPRVGVSGTAYNRNGLFVWFNLNAELPTSEGAIRDQLITSIGGFQEIVYNVPSTRTDLIFWNWTRVFSYLKASSGQSIAGSVQPTLRYALTPKFKPVFTVEVPYLLERAAKGGEFVTSAAILRPGFSWDVSSRINVMPYLMLRPAAPLTPDSTTFGMWLSGTIL